MQYTSNYNIPKYDGTDLLNPTSREGLNSGNDIIDTQLKNNADAILTKANDSAVIKGVKVAGTELTKDSDGKVNVPVATDSAGGVVKVSSGYGTGMSSDGIIRTVKAENGDIDAKTNVYRPIVPSKLDYAILKGLESNSQIDTATKKKAICNTIGATFDGQFELIEEITLTEDIATFERTQTPSSYSGGVKNYAFSNVFINIKIPTTDGVALGFAVNTNNPTYSNAKVSTAQVSPLVNSYFQFFAEKKHNLTFYKCAYYKGMASSYTGTPLLSPIVDNNMTITKIGLGTLITSQYGLIKSGTKIQIYGVWA